jgi:hypothetical protein
LEKAGLKRRLFFVDIKLTPDEMSKLCKVPKVAGGTVRSSCAVRRCAVPIEARPVICCAVIC